MLQKPGYAPAWSAKGSYADFTLLVFINNYNYYSWFNERKAIVTFYEWILLRNSWNWGEFLFIIKFTTTFQNFKITWGRPPSRREKPPLPHPSPQHADAGALHLWSSYFNFPPATFLQIENHAKAISSMLQQKVPLIAHSICIKQTFWTFVKICV